MEDMILVMFHKRKSKSEESETLEFSPVQNMLYIMKETFRFQKLLIPLLAIATITASIQEYFPSIMIKVIIREIEQEVSIKRLGVISLMLSLTLIIIAGLNTYTNTHISWRMFDSRIKFMMKRVHKVLYMNYEDFESPKVMEIAQKAYRATEGETVGVEGMMHSFQNITIMLLKIIFAIIVLGLLNPWIVVCSLVIGFMVFLQTDKTLAYDKKVIWDTMPPFMRIDYYMENMTTNFMFAKDIRLFSMRDWIMNKYEMMHNIMHHKLVQSDNRWKRSNMLGSSGFMTLNIIIYAYLTYCVLKKGMTIDNYIFYIGTSTTFHQTLFSVFITLTRLREYSREVNDFRTFLEYPESKTYESDVIPIPKCDRYEFVFQDVSFKYSGER